MQISRHSPLTSIFYGYVHVQDVILVKPSFVHPISPIEYAISELQSKDKIKWTDGFCQNFKTAQHTLKIAK
jgi:hypothetical protein